MPRVIISSCRTWPLWLWAEHLILTGFVGRRAARLVRVLWQARRQSRLTEKDEQQRAVSTPQASTDGIQVAARNPKSGAAAVGEPAALDGLSPAPGSPGLGPLARAVLSSMAQLKLLSGPLDVLTWPDVAPAPTATLDMEAVAEGQAACFRDGRGAIYKFKLAEDVYINMYYTKAGFRRSGDLHDCNQYDVVLRGRTRLRMIDPHTGREVVQEFGANDFIVIPARTPHMFEFLEDNYLLEWWDDTFRAWYYKPYRDIIDKGLPLANTEDKDLSLLPLDLIRIPTSQLG